MVAGYDQFSASLALEPGAETGNPQGFLLRPFVSADITAMDDTGFQVTSAFSDAIASVAPQAEVERSPIDVR